jgi:DNA-binding transcriptional ArsR family regulator
MDNKRARAGLRSGVASGAPSAAAPAAAAAHPPVALNGLFHALSDPTRRAIVTRLGRGPATVSDLAAPFPIALPSLLKHLTVLERSGLLRSRKHGRVRTCELAPRALAPAERWLADQRAVWEARSDRMARVAESIHPEDPDDPRSRPDPEPGSAR